MCVYFLQSLSAAHVLMADEFKSRGGSADDLPIPQALQSQWEKVKTLKKSQDNITKMELSWETESIAISHDTIADAVTVSENL